MRKEFKNNMKGCEKGSVEYHSYDALQTQMKLVGNTLYGTFACPQLAVSNVVVANNITAALRGVIWCASVALNGYQDITDGFLYGLNELTLAHVAKFFESEEHPISLLSTTVDEHKDVYVSATFHGQTNYQFEHATGELKTKARGNKLKGKPYTGGEEARILRLFKDIKERPNAIPAYRPQTISQVLLCNQANMMFESKTDNIYKRNGLEVSSQTTVSIGIPV